MPMADPLTVVNARSARLLPAAASAVELIGRSAAVGRVQELVRRAALRDTGVLLVAESGSDVESVAREVHARSRPPAAPWLVIDCGAPSADTELALFGRLPVCTPADLESIGTDSRLVAARAGTLFLRDVAELPSGLQARLARAARDGEVCIDGEPRPLEVRLVAGASPGIDGDLREHRFRADLYRRLAETRIDLPPLRERKDDVPALATQLLEEACAANAVPTRRFTQPALMLLAALSWPGNLAELRAFVADILAETSDEEISIDRVLPSLRLERSLAPFVPSGSLREARLRFEREYIAAILQHHGWRIAEAARALGIQRPNLYRKARQLGIPVTRQSDQRWNS
jgi:DNA-binding NtrC family response regulator